MHALNRACNRCSMSSRPSNSRKRPRRLPMCGDTSSLTSRLEHSNNTIDTLDILADDEEMLNVQIQVANPHLLGVLDPPIPTLDTILSSRIPMMSHVPKLCRPLWCECLLEALQSFLSCPTWISLRKLLILPKCVLFGKPRGGTQHRNQAAHVVLPRLRLWQQGEILQLWAEAEQLLPGSRRLRSRDSEKTVFAAVEKAISEGNDSKACHLLTSSGMADNVPESLEQLRRLHPQSANSLNSCHKNNVFSRTSNPVKWLEVEAALKSFKPGTAAGPSGLDVQFLREALQ